MQIKAIPYNINLLRGSGYLDCIEASYDKLVELFGQPEPGRDSKTAFEWHVQVGGCVHSIYDYKDDKWHIGGFSRANFVEKLKEYITNS